MTVYMLYHDSTNPDQGKLMNFVYKIYSQASVLIGEIVRTEYKNFNVSELLNVVPKKMNSENSPVANG